MGSSRAIQAHYKISPRFSVCKRMCICLCHFPHNSFGDYMLQHAVLVKALFEMAPFCRIYPAHIGHQLITSNKYLFLFLTSDWFSDKQLFFNKDVRALQL
jgi:hypothetical protein